MRAPSDKATYFPTEDQEIADKRIEDFFFNGVSLFVSGMSEEVVCYFRASRFKSAKSDQYYAVAKWTGERGVATVIREMKAQLVGPVTNSSRVRLW